MEALSSFVRVPEGQKYVFEWRGEQLTSSNAAKALQHVCAAAVPKGRKLTATMVRKCTATQIRAKNPQQREMVTGHMAHLPSTQETHYINPLQSDESIIAFEAIQSLYGRDTIHEEAESSGCFRPEDIARCIHSDESHNSEEASPAEESATKTRDKTENLETVVLTADVRKYKSRRQFTEEENSEVKSYFAERIRNKQRIFIAEARAALEQGPLSLCANKTAKQIQDRVAGFIRSAERREKCFDF
ncbi:uncharacterized protein LOC143452296 [Clavelina lepadiformis]|uniref:uncharacterized protein LOC143452296 n=1 Tax=Clavelina lepadiformis TaxID=159417 RepID=UPI00404239A3